MPYEYMLKLAHTIYLEYAIEYYNNMLSEEKEVN